MQKIANIAVVLLIGLSLAACNTTKEPPTTAVVLVDKPQLNLPPVDNVKLKDVDWVIISKSAKTGEPGSTDAAFRKAHSESLLAVSPSDYEDLSINTANLLKVIKQYQAQLRAYADYYARDNAQNTKDAGNGTKTAPR
jgi:hypothetical protein